MNDARDARALSRTETSRTIAGLTCGAVALTWFCSWLMDTTVGVRLSSEWAAIPSFFFFSFDVMLAGLVVARYVAGHRERDLSDPVSLSGVGHVPVLVPLLVRGEKDLDTVEDLLEACSVGRFGLQNEIWLAVDFADSDRRWSVGDERLLEALARIVERWTTARWRHGASAVSILVRPRQWNLYEGHWMGRERKRGKIEEILRFAAGEPHPFRTIGPASPCSADFLFVMDGDSRIEAGDLAALQTAFLSARETADATRMPALMAPVVKKLSREREPFERWLVEPELFEHFFINSSPTLKQDGVGQDIYHGKAMLHVRDFLENCTAFVPNTILSHDHIESLYGFGQSTHRAKAYEPFPSSRSDWERRQHRWVRGDVQVLPYLLGFRRLGRNNMTLSQRVGALQVVIGAEMPFFQFLFVAANFGVGLTSGALAFLILILIDQRGVLFGGIDVLRRNGEKEDHPGAARLMLHALSNNILASVGLAMFLLRNFLITVDATVVAVTRMLRGRVRLLEWYPANPKTVITRLRLSEGGMMTLFVIMAGYGRSSVWLPVAGAFWISAPLLVASISKRRLR